MSDLTIYAELNIEWINTLIRQTFAPPSYDTLWWLLVRSPPIAFKQLLQKWFANIPQEARDQLLIIDGKRLKGVSTDEHLVHFVELFAAEQRLVLAQEKVPDKSSEPKVIEALLKDIDVSEALISTDALFAHTARAQQFLDHDADCLIGLKGNQGNFQAEAKNFFDQAREVEYEEVDVERYIPSPEKGDGRIEQRSKYCPKGRSMERKLLKFDTISRFVEEQQKNLQGRLEAFGRLRIHCIEYWM